MRFPDFLRTSVLLFGGSATALAAAALAGAGTRDDRALLYAALGWWVLSAAIGGWLGRRPEPSRGIARVLATARAQSAIPELEPGTVLFNRLWPLAVLTVAAGGLVFIYPQIPAIAAGYAVIATLGWRRQSAAVEAIEGRDGVRFYIDRVSPFKPIRLIRTPGLRRIEPVEARRREADPAPP